MNLSPEWVEVLEVHRSALEQGALVVVDEANQRVRILPLSTGKPPDR
jgi:hypothetical protein